jgi:hypothetical protein
MVLVVLSDITRVGIFDISARLAAFAVGIFFAPVCFLPNFIIVMAVYHHPMIFLFSSVSSYISPLFCKKGKTQKVSVLQEKQEGRSVIRMTCFESLDIPDLS